MACGKPPAYGIEALTGDDRFIEFQAGRGGSSLLAPARHGFEGGARAIARGAYAGDRSGRGEGDAAAPDHRDGFKAAAPHLRQAHDLLPVVGADARWHLRNTRHLYSR